MIDKNKTYKTRDGRFQARVYCVDGGGIYTVHGAILVNGLWQPREWTIDGLFSVYGECHADLIEVKPKRTIEFWVNVYEEDVVYLPHRTRLQADKFEMKDRIACLHFTREFEEGEGL